MEKNELLVKIEQNNQIIKLNIIDYIDNIKVSGFYGGFIEIFALSKINNISIIILTPLIKTNEKYYKFTMLYNYTNKNYINLN